MIDEQRLPPNNREAEAAWLGSILIDPETLFTTQNLKPPHFYQANHRYIHEAFLALAQSDSDIDTITVCDELRKQGRLQEIGGEAYIAGLGSNPDSYFHAQSYADMVVEAHERREIIKAGLKMLNLAYDESVTLEDARATIQSDLIAITAGTQKRQTMFTAVEASDNFMADLEGDAPVGLPTGLADLDKCIGGMESGNVYGFGGAEKMGKSTLLMDISRHVALMPNKPVVLRFSLEMSEKLMMRRDVSALTGISIQNIKRRTLAEGAMGVLYEAVAKMRETNMIYETTRGLTPAQMIAKARQVELMYGKIDLIHVDYLQIMNSDKNHANDASEGEYIAQRLAEVAGMFDCPLIVGAQVLSKSISQRADKEPQLSDVRYSSGLQANAYFVAFVHRPHYYAPDMYDITEAQLIVRAHRDGAAPTIPLYFEAECATFKNAFKQNL